MDGARLRKAIRSALTYLRGPGARELERIRTLRRYIRQYEVEHREIYLQCKAKRTLVERPCPICSAKASDFFLRNTTGAEYRVCRECDLVFMSPILDHDSLERVYTMHQTGAKKTFWRYLMDDAPKLSEPPEVPPYEIRLLKQFRDGGRLLDFGCSYGGFLNVARFYFDAVGVEIDPITSRFARDELGLRVLTKDIFDPSLESENAFDIITMRQVIEHLEDPRAVVNRLRSCLRRDGCIFIECPNSKSYSMRILGKHHALVLGNEHVNLFSLESMEKLLRECGFEVLHAETYKLDLALYDILGLWLAPIRHFHHRYSFRNSFTMRVLSYPDVLFRRAVLRKMADDKGFGSYLRVVAGKRQG